MAVFGDTLRQARAHKGVTLREAEQKTRINRHHLLALEEERFHELPALIYQRGIVKNYGTYLDLDPNKLLTMFEDARGIDPEELEARIPVQTPIGVPQHFSPNFAIIAFFVVMSAVVFAWTYSVYFAPPGATSTPTEVIPTVTPLQSDSMFGPSPIIIPNTPTPSVTATAAASPTAKPTKQATATATTKPDNGANTNTIVPTGGNSSDSNASAANSGNADSSTADANASDANASAANSADTVDASATQTPADGQISLDFVATTDLDSLTVVVDGNNVFDSSLANGDATGYLTGTNFEIHVSDPNGLKIYKDGNSFQMGLSTFSLP
jgi:cytoskeleton protein RodZ